MKKIYLINLSYGIAGTEKRFLNIWKVLKSRGNVIPILVVPDTQAKLFSEARMLDLEDKNLWMISESPLIRKIFKARFNNNYLNDIVTIARSRFMALSYLLVWKKIKKEKNVIIHMGMKCSALFPPNFPIVYECVDSTLSEFRRGHFLRASKKRSVINCQTDRIRAALEAAYAHEKTDWFTITSPSYFADYSHNIYTDIKKDKNLVLFVGRMAQEKNPELLVNAVAEVCKQGLQPRVRIFGEGSLLHKIKILITESGLDNVIEIGFTKTPAKYLAEAAIFVSLQSGDNYGSQSLLEAMSAACAIIATNAGETERIINESNGVLVGFDKDELAKAIVELISDPAKAKMLGEQGSKLVHEQYTADSYAAYLETLYQRAENIFSLTNNK